MIRCLLLSYIKKLNVHHIFWSCCVYMYMYVWIYSKELSGMIIEAEKCQVFNLAARDPGELVVLLPVQTPARSRPWVLRQEETNVQATTVRQVFLFTPKSLYSFISLVETHSHLGVIYFIQFTKKMLISYKISSQTNPEKNMIKYLFKGKISHDPSEKGTYVGGMYWFLTLLILIFQEAWKMFEELGTSVSCGPS